MTEPIQVTLLGATGLTGSKALEAFVKSKKTPFAITTIARKAIEAQQAGNSQTTFTHKLVPNMFDAPKETVGTSGGVYVSCLGTTRAAAGGLEAQEKIDLVLNRDLATKAKADGAKTVRPSFSTMSVEIEIAWHSYQLILVSSGGASATSRFPYPKMKGQLEEDVKALKFDHCIILRPGMLLGQR